MMLEEKVNIEKLVDLYLPPLPAHALRVAKLTRDLNTSSHKIADAISFDPGLTASILRIANSALYRRGKRITSLVAGVNRLGNRIIYQSVIGFAFSNILMDKKKSSKLETSLWEHCVCVALACREISIILSMIGTEEAFLCGLLHDIGKLLMLRFDPKAYEEIAKIQQEHTMLECEMDLFGYTHSQVGSLVAAKWELPQEIVFGISNHHQESKSVSATLYSHIINISDNLVNSHELGFRHLEDYDFSLCQSAQSLNLSKELLEVIWSNVTTNLVEILSIWN